MKWGIRQVEYWLFSYIKLKSKNPDTNRITSQPKEVAEASAAYYKNLYEGQELIGKEEKTIRHRMRQK